MTIIDKASKRADLEISRRLFDRILSLTTVFKKSISSFPINKDPVVGLSISDKILSNVDFPEPDGPMREYILPFENE